MKKRDGSAINSKKEIRFNLWERIRTKDEVEKLQEKFWEFEPCQ
jgi:hypothetical protein